VERRRRVRLPAELRRTRDRLRRLTESLRASLATGEGDEGGTLASYDNHPADSASTVARRETDLGIWTGLDGRLVETHRAVAKWREGSYGLCDRCGAPIDRDRLAARPESVLCLACAEEAEAARTRPLAGEVGVRAPLARRLDGEDTLSAELERWGSSDTPQDVPPTVDYDAMDGGAEAAAGLVEPVEGSVGESGDPLPHYLRGRWRRKGQSVARLTTERDPDQPT
jgi:DnaK suppressor protein